MPRISVIIPTHNRPVLLAEALTSLLAQTFADWEAVIVDDASSPPATVDDKDARIHVLHHNASQGGAAAKNSGIKNATGEILAFLDDDDLYAPQYLARALDILDRHPELDVVFMGVLWFGKNSAWGQRSYDEAMSKCLADARGQRIDNNVIFFDESLLFALLKSVPMAFQRPVVRIEALERIGTYRPDCLLWDCDWAISAALNAKTALITDGLYLQREEGQGYSSRRDRILEHLHSGIEIKDRIFHEARLRRSPPHRMALLRDAAAQGWFDLAWHHYLQQRRLKALGALWQSESRKFSLSNLRLLARLLLPGK
ncbi:MAG: glycosyltransferase family 2 protein [Sulfurimicrobium sp.]|nr:glycosyltransferase family 2 protein [Sulfurimicrobium sp.]